MDTNGRMLKIAEVEQLVGLSRPSVYRRMKDSSFPKSKRLGPRASRWSENEVVA
jgi:prophage regulatory protein